MKTNAVLLLGLVLAGCVPSWNPFYTEKDLAFDPALVGRWRPADASLASRETWEFTRGSGQFYQLTQRDEEGREAAFEARLFKLKDQRFLDLHLTRVEGEGLKVNAWASISLVPAHLLLKVDEIGPDLQLAAMSPEWVKDFLKQHPDAIAHRVTADGSIVLAATTSELQQFVLAHVADKEFFGGPMRLLRQ